MKKSFSILFLIGCSFAIQAQQYFPFIEEGKTWAELNVIQHGYPDPPFTTYSTFSFKLEGDTLFEGRTWKKLFTTMTDPAFGNWQQEFCLYREEGSKVYSYCDIIAGEKLMYDFSLNVGDSVYYEGMDWWTYVVETDSVEVNGEFRRRIHFGNPAEVWIEGLGSTCRPFQPIEGQFILPGGYSLLCVSNQEGLIYRDSLYNECFIEATLHTGVKESGNPAPQVAVCYDIENRALRIGIDNDTIKFRQYRLFNAAGVLVKEGGISGNPFFISCAELRSGMYILFLSGPNLVNSVKFSVN